MSRLPIRIRLTLPFAVAMAAVLAALGGFVYLRVGSTLLSSTDQTLLAHATEATLRIDRGKTPLDLDSASGVRFAQVLDANGAVVLSQPAGLPALLDGAATRRVAGGGSLRLSTAVTGASGRWRLLAIPDTADGSHRALVLGSSLDDRSESLERLRKELFVGSPLALLLAALAGYVLAGAALRPVEEMRRKAANISAATPGSRLPVPVAKDEIQRLAETLNDMLARLETVVRARAAVRRRREPRATHAALAAEDRARAGASPSPVARRARGRTALGRRGDRPADCARRRPAPDRPIRSGRCSGQPRAARLGRRARCRGGALLGSRR